MATAATVPRCSRLGIRVRRMGSAPKASASPSVCCATACDGVARSAMPAVTGACTTAQDGAYCGDEAICCSGDCVDGVCCAERDCQNAGAPQCVDHDCACVAQQQ